MIDSAGQSDSYRRFMQAANVFLGGLMGVLVGVPISVSTPTRGIGAVVVAATLAFGVLTGYRRRRSRAFLYFALAGVLILSTLVSFSLLAPEGP